ncbi:formyltransferase family protein [Nisaea sediminum]|uniref:formyltransferase family protein n=1 Tax=Nisaea sediminum TaxID=2775867 RepID=UPI001866BDAD|nr:formyltransferase family protein [Nisaea sediminum]
MRYGILAEFSGELSLEYIAESLDRNLVPDFIVFCGSESDPERERLVAERTEGRYRRKVLSKIEGIEKIPAYFVPELNSEVTLDVIKGLSPDLLVSGATKIIKIPIWDHVRLGALNCHSGYIQEFRGCSCVEWAILKQRPVGATVHLLNQRIDAGPVVVQKVMEIKKGETYPAVRTNMIYHQARLMIDAVEMAMRNPEDFHQDVELGDYYKPMRDLELVRDVEGILKEEKYQHYAAV